MDFGKVDDLSKVKFRLPEDNPDTEKLLKSLKKKKAVPNVYMGCAKWGRKEWIGSLYPVKTKEADFLKFYVKEFNSIELNAMFYRVFPKETVAKWASYADDNFRFAPKMPQIVTHIRRLKNVEADTEKILESFSGFGDKIGHTFLQFDDRFAPNAANIENLHNYLKYLPKDFKVAVEFRHVDWFKDSVEAQEGWDMLREMKAASIITDTAGRRDVVHMRLTTPTAFIRYVGNDGDPTDFKRMDEWAKRMTKWIEGGVDTVYFFMHTHEEKNSPQLCKYSIEALNKAAGLKIVPPKLLDGGAGKLF
ncbi:MAG: hypothetical protein JWO03_1585 [Bacteroidetes bacterium]|nr:hypothetical protein [Bacteroidota bacterium]